MTEVGFAVRFANLDETVLRHIPEEGSVHSYRSENLQVPITNVVN
jgi:hypothetical protein